MYFPILKPEIQQFIANHIGSDLSKLALQKNPFPDVEWMAVLNQIAAKSKAKDKLPSWFATPNIVYPAKLSVEQTSSETTALYKSKLISGESLIDLTGGFGVDDYYFSKQIKHVVHCEINMELSQIVKHNCDSLNISNIKCIAGDSTEILRNAGLKFDWIYIDPSRRNDTKGKVFLLKDCLPDVPALLNLYMECADNIMIKTAPILDIAAGLSELKYVKSIHIVAVENEVKELLWEISKHYSGEIKIQTVNFSKGNEEKFDFVLGNEVHPNFSLPKKYLYEPNSAVMKSGGFNQVSRYFQLEKLHPHSHLYTSERIIDFPGRIFEIRHSMAYNKAEMKEFLENKKANVTTRNFPDSVENIRKKWKIKDGGNDYCFFTTDANHHKIVLICTKIK